MIGEMIKEYLVGLGVKIDQPGFDQLHNTINGTSQTIESATGKWARNFTAASAVIMTSIASITTAVGGLMRSVAQQDLEMTKLARRMMVSKDAAWEMKKATDALGESVNDIILTPELMDRYSRLVNDGRQMKVGGDFAETMKGFRDLAFEFTRLKQEVSYAMTWVGYYLMKYLNRPLTEAREKFKAFNDSFIRNMSTWTEKAAKSLVYIINVGAHFFEFIGSVTKAIYTMWRAFPKGVKIATAALTGMWLVINASPLSRMIMLVGTLLLLSDDYFGYMEGKQAEFGTYWDKLNAYIEIGKNLIQEMADIAEPFLERFVAYAISAKDKIIDFAQGIGAFADRIRNSSELNDFLETIQGLGKAFWNLGSGIVDAVSECIKIFYDALRDTGTGREFQGLLERIWYIYLALLRAISYCTDILAGWLREAARSEVVRELLYAVADLVDAFLELFNAIMDLAKEALPELFNGMDNTKHVYSFRDALKDVVKLIVAMIRYLTDVIRALSKFFKMMMDNRIFKAFWHSLGEEIKRELDLIMKVIGAIGKAGRALLALSKGDFKGAYRLAKSIFDGSGSDNRGSNAGTGNNDWNAKVVYQRFKSAGYSDEAIAGIMGRLQQEHNFSTDDVPERDVPGVGHVGGYGIFQWNGGRTTDFLDWAERQGLDPHDPGVQADYAIWEAKQRGQGPEAMDGMTVSESADFWTDKFEVGNHGDEQAYAADWWDKISSGKVLEANPANGNQYPSSNDDDSTNSPSYADTSYVIQNGVEDSDLSNTNRDLVDKFNELAYDLHKEGYDLQVSGGWRSPENNESVNGADDSKHLTGDAIDFIIVGDYDPDVIGRIAQEHGLDTYYHDAGSGYHFHTTQNDEMPTAYNGQQYAVDPLLFNGLMQGGYQSGYGSSSVVYQVNVGGVTVQGGSNASAHDIGQSVGNETMRRLEERGKFILQSRTLNGSPVMV